MKGAIKSGLMILVYTRYAALGGHLDVIQWARKHELRWNEAACDNAALSGHTNLMLWLLDNGCPSRGWTICESAARGGHLETLIAARAYGCEWDELTCIRAAEAGHLDVLQWAKANKCPCDQWKYAGTPHVVAIWRY